MIRVVPIRVLRATAGHVALLSASETTPLLPILDAFFIGELLERNGSSVDFHGYYVIVGVGASVGIVSLVGLEVAGVTCLLVMTEIVESLVFDLSSSLDFFSGRLLPSVHVDGPIFAVQNFTMDDVSQARPIASDGPLTIMFPSCC